MTETLRVASYNVLCGERGSPEAFAELLKPYGFDLIAFCEAPSGNWTYEVGRHLGMEHNFVGLISTANHKNKYKSILSRTPLHGAYEYEICESRWGEYCSTVRSVTEIHEHPIVFYSLHIPKNPGLKDTGAEFLTSQILSHEQRGNLIVAGDFNCILQHETMTHLVANGMRSLWHDLDIDVTTHSSMEHPEAGIIDHIVFDPNSFNVLDGGLIESSPMLSDHKPIWGEFEFRNDIEKS